MGYFLNGIVWLVKPRERNLLNYGTEGFLPRLLFAVKREVVMRLLAFALIIILGVA
jgi:hypothetical protein